ncbi:MAG TPA: TetR/AcrR family transcriptional regulator [Geminicoccaceae bacterium]|nr:TetR/AcrR family transcriptional regulator [Geminicoccus sp.]HMU49547.1 TetR/AcrR family transcriptional regulator [Geminicoccaceae bacterium]
MARPKEFDRDDALGRAIEVFSDRGYEGASTTALLEAMGISRQSMYDTFGDKWQLYLECLRSYTADSIGQQMRALNAASSPMKGLEAHLMRTVDEALARPVAKCLGVSAVSEFGRSDPEVTAITDVASRTLLGAVERRVAEAKAAGETPADIDCREAANFVLATLTGIKVAARAGGSAESLRGVAKMALRSLRRP